MNMLQNYNKNIYKAAILILNNVKQVKKVKYIKRKVVPILLSLQEVYSNVTKIYADNNCSLRHKEGSLKS